MNCSNFIHCTYRYEDSDNRTLGECQMYEIGKKKIIKGEMRNQPCYLCVRFAYALHNKPTSIGCRGPFAYTERFQYTSLATID